jgi:hypothetical protein
MALYVCDVDGRRSEVEAAGAFAAAEAFVERGWENNGSETFWVRVKVVLASDLEKDPAAEWESYTVAVHPPEPPCLRDGLYHDWHDDVEVGGGVRVYDDGSERWTFACSYCGKYEHTLVGAQAPWGEDGLTKVWYEAADERSRKWVESFSKDDDDGDR